MIIRILALILYLVSTYYIAKAGVGVECIGVIAGLNLMAWGHKRSTQFILA